MNNRAVVLTISDRCARGDAVDRSGPAIVDLLPTLDARLVHREVVPDEPERIRRCAREWIDRCELFVSTGGTGVADRDITPEALADLLDRPLPGFGEAMRMSTFARNPLTIMSRSGGGVAGRSLLVWLPGSPKAVAECLDVLAPAIRHVCQFLRGKAPH